MKVLVPDSIPLDLHSSTPDIHYCIYDVSSTDLAAHADASMLVAWNNSAGNLEAARTQLPDLKLVQTLAAGPDHVLAVGFAPEIEIASGRSLHDATVAEHGLALTLAAVRNLDGLMNSQRNRYWDQEFIAAQAHPKSASLYTLSGAKVIIVGFGSIAASLAPLLTSLGASIEGVAQSAGDRAGYKVHAIADLAKAVEDADVVISLLPYSSKTEKFFGTSFFASMKSTAIFINIGRGKTVDEEALVDALVSKKIRKAVVDVTYVEPLPESSALWTVENLLITPHVSGGRPRGSEALIQEQALALLSGNPLRNLVTR